MKRTKIILPKELVERNFTTPILTFSIGNINSREPTIITPQLVTYNLKKEKLNTYTEDAIVVAKTYQSHQTTFTLTEDDLKQVGYLQIELIVDNLSSENQLQFNRLMLNEGKYEEYTQPEAIIESARISFINTFYANLHTNNQGYLQVIRPNHDSFTTNTLTRSKCTVIAPHIKNECLEDTHENLSLEYMNLSDQVLEILR